MTCPPATIAQACRCPAEIAVAPVTPGMGVGVTVEPAQPAYSGLPSNSVPAGTGGPPWPRAPQHSTAPPDKRAHVYPLPAETAVTPESPGTLTGPSQPPSGETTPSSPF